MTSYEESYLNQRPQHLCNMCGKCCRVVYTPIPYNELLEKYKAGEQAAIDFLDIFVPYESMSKAKEVDSSIVDNIITLSKIDNPNFEESNMTFYYCKFLQDNNMCGNYEHRPTLCRHFPSTPWSIVPPGCGFEGWLFGRREDEKAKIRKVKEELLDLKVLESKTKDTELLMKIQAVKNKLQQRIDLFKKYGSENW